MFVQRNKFFNFKYFEFLIPGLIRRMHAFLRYSFSENTDAYYANVFLELLSLTLLKVFLENIRVKINFLARFTGYSLQQMSFSYFSDAPTHRD